jgi:hypothetical protein
MCADAQLQGGAPLHRCKNMQHCGTSHARSADRSHRRVTASHCTADQAVLPSHIARLALWHTQRSAGGCSLAATQCVPQWRLDLRRVFSFGNGSFLDYAPSSRCPSVARVAASALIGKPVRASLNIHSTSIQTATVLRNFALAGDAHFPRTRPRSS